MVSQVNNFNHATLCNLTNKPNFKQHCIRQELSIIELLLSNAIYSFPHFLHAFSPPTLLAGRQKGNLACKKTKCWCSGGGDLT